VIDARDPNFGVGLDGIDVVIDTVGGDVQARSVRALRPGGVIVSAVSTPDSTLNAAAQVRGEYFIVDVDSPCLERIASRIDSGALHVPVGSVLPLQRAGEAHRMLDGLQARPRGKIVLAIDA
jgi:NADPH:quinone reductase-like Zn-dependent oxidoreductase